MWDVKILISYEKFFFNVKIGFAAFFRGRKSYITCRNDNAFGIFKVSYEIAYVEEKFSRE